MAQPYFDRLTEKLRESNPSKRETYPTLISDRIARPLGLQRTFVAQSLSEMSSLASAPSALLSPDGRLEDTREVYHPGWVSHGVVASTPSEITRFFAGLFAGELFSRRSLVEKLVFAAMGLAGES